MSVDATGQGLTLQPTVAPTGNSSDSTRVSLYRRGDGLPRPLLHIPHGIMKLYSLKPRKWLLFVAATICGATGTLRLLDRNEDLIEREMDEDVEPGDCYVFCYEGQEHFLDWMLRRARHSQSMTSSRSRIVPAALREYYGGCPFTRMRPELCDVCHLVPYAKGRPVSVRVAGCNLM